MLLLLLLNFLFNFLVHVFFLQWANGVRATKTCGFFLCSSSFDDVNITVKPWGGARNSTDVYNCPFYSFLFFGKTSSIT